MNNYSTKVVHLNEVADQDLLGVQVGRFCISFNIPVAKVAQDLDVSKTVVYKWFTGRHDVGKHLREKVQAYYRALPDLAAGGYGN